MIEFVLGVLFSPIALGMFVLFAIWAEHLDSSRFTVFWAVIAGFIAWQVFGISWQVLAFSAIVYFPIGFAWSFWRYTKYCNKVVSDVEKGVVKKDAAESKMDPRNNAERIVLWIFAWPFSFIDTILGDMIDAVSLLVRTVFKGTYTRIAEKAMSRLEGK